MRRGGKHLLIGLLVFLAIAGALAGVAVWAWRTPEGTRALFKVVSLLSPVRIEGAEISGRMRDELKIRGLRISWPQGEMRAESAHLRWRGADLFRGKILVDQLSLTGVRILDDRPPSPDFSFRGWPVAPFWLSRLQGRVDSLRIEGLSYRRLRQEPAGAAEIFARLTWEGEVLRISDFTAAAPSGRAAGRLELGFSTPALKLDLRADLAGEYAGADAIAAELRLEPVAEREEAGGKVLISGLRQGRERWRGEGDLSVTRAALDCRNLRFFLPGRKGTVRAEGQLVFSAKPVWRVKADFADWDLAPEFGTATDLSGNVEVKGSPEDYRGKFLLRNRRPGWQEAQASGTFHGGREAVEFTGFDAAWLQGSLQGPLKISWADGIVVQGKLRGRRLNPSVVDPNWPGEINLNLEGRFIFAKAGTPEAIFTAALLESRLRGWPITGEAAGSWREKLLQVERLQLRGPGLDLQAQGLLHEKITLEARVADLSRLLPDGRGDLAASGWLRFRDRRLNGTIEVRGKELSLYKGKAGAVQARLDLQDYDFKGVPAFALTAQADGLQAGAIPLESAELTLLGTSAAHRAQVALRLKDGEIRGELGGGYAGGSWKGTIERLTGREARGLWKAQGPAGVLLSAEQLRLTPLTLKSSRGETLQVQADLALNPASGFSRVQWEPIELARANPWLGRGSLAGQASGSLTVRWREGAAARLSGSSRLQGGFTDGRIKAEASSAEVRFDWDEKGLEAAAALTLKQGGAVDAKISSAEGVRAAIPREGKVALQWKAIELELFSALLPATLGVKGQGAGSLQGRWFEGLRFEAAGGMKLSQSQVAWKGKPKPVTANLEKAEADFSWRGESIQGKFSLAAADRGWIQGDFQLPLEARLSPAVAPGGALKVAVQGMVRDNGLLAVLYPERIAKSQGRVELDLQAEGPWGRPRYKGSLRVAEVGLQLAAAQEPSGKKDNGPRPLKVEIRSAEAVIDWGAQGLSAVLTAALEGKTRIDGRITSSEPGQTGWPRRGRVELQLANLDLSFLQPFLPRGFQLEGQASGQLSGQWLPGWRLDLTGTVKADRGKMSWRSDHGLISAALEQAGADFSWRGESLQGGIALSLAEYGSLQGRFRLPLAARMMPYFDPRGPVQLALQGQAQEKGLLAALFPGVIRESRGNLDLDLRVEGSWEKPVPRGTLRLTRAGASLPGLGIRIEELAAQCRFQGDQIQVESFQARSGPGTVKGAATVWVRGAAVQRFQGSLQGEKFQTINMPDLQLQTSPRLTFQGTPQSFAVKGELLLPEVLVYRASTQDVKGTSGDLVVVDQPPVQGSRRAVDIQVRITLGDRVQVKAGGIDARLSGGFDLKATGAMPEEATARGEVRVAEGTYGGYGLSLRIERGRLIYAGGPVNNPGLDILALRRERDLEKQYDIRVGVAILGTLQNPNVKLYSQPAMKDEDVLSYLVQGRPYDPQKGGIGLLLSGAGALFGGGSGGMVDRLKSRLGIDRVDIEAAGGSGSGDMTRSMVTIGKYLTPQLFIAYGVSVFTSEQILRLRYQVTKHWELETWRGNETGIDLFYKIDFY